jgi:hypothetical protein
MLIIRRRRRKRSQYDKFTDQTDPPVIAPPVKNVTISEDGSFVYDNSEEDENVIAVTK